MAILSEADRVDGISVLVPVYNSEGSIRLLCDRLLAVLPSLARQYEVILVDDGSRDGSWGVASDLARCHDSIHAIRLMRNYGQHNALLCGLRAARHGITVTLDDDLQHPPEEIPHLLRVLAAGNDVVYGVPHERTHVLWRNLASKYTRVVLSRAMGIDVRQVNAFRAFRTELRRAFDGYQSPTLLLDVLLSWGTTKFESVSVRHEPRRIGRSNYTFARLVNQAMFLLTGFSTAPLRMASFIGFTFTLFGVGVLGYAIAQYFTSGSVPGFTFLASIIAIFSGAQLFSLGIIGEYIARIFQRSMERPTYVVASALDVTPAPVAAADTSGPPHLIRSS